jgi:small multidrug resistance pump
MLKEMTDMYGAFLLLAVAIVVEVGATALLPKAQGFSHPGWSAVVLVGYGVSIWLLTVVVKQLPVSVAYAIWAGLGTALVAVVGLLFLGEHLSWIKAVSLALIVAGVVGLNLAGAH